MNTKLILPIALLAALLASSCNSHREYIQDSITHEKIVGYGKKCKYRIGHTTPTDISEAEISRLMTEKLEFKFKESSTSEKKDGSILFAVEWGSLTTRKGIKTGDSVEKALKAYGKPKARLIDYGYDEQHRIHFEMPPGLFYKNLTFFVDSTETTIMGICLGPQFDLSKKYIKK
jgi:hypothetical protein